ncbi:hypothetical protein B9Z55_001529 [Caenorhabditis nigoni]|uniref:Uncharacterized protein n=1 Tax=Caenorhabditis nigoni TaxID=1611254 RepID=A0A2G5VG45_9PELO|nr:hypothetical protein B9Z55_001529 [Caenorhabditis nigoni]
MSSSSSDENETTIHSSSKPGSSGIYSQLKAGSSKRPSVRHDVSDAEDDEEPYEGFRKDMNMEVDERITTLLSSLHFEQKREVVTADEDDNKLRELHEKIFSLITTEPDFNRRRRLKKALPASNCIREQVYYLRRKPITPPDSYYHRLNAALHTIVKESFGEEYRKVATVLGLVEALAEVLILEVHAFGIPETNAVEHRNIRKLIANALTNLTYGQILSKRRLCSYDGFIRCVVRIIIESPNITQVYAGLIRNLSWNADSGMSEALQPTVHALSLAAVYAHTHRFDVTAILSALWNLAGHSVENKRTICETPNCLKVLANILSPDARFTTLVDSASGILKYVSQYLATNSSHLEFQLRSLLITRMLTLLKSSSFTCVTNTLGAIAHLIAKDPHMQQLIRQDAAAVQQLNVLRNSNREDIRKAVKEVLNTLNQPCSHRYGDMSHSVGGASGMLSEPHLQMQTSHHGYHGTASPRLLSLRATRASPGKYIHPSQQQQMPVPAPDQRSSSLPRHFAVQRNGFMMAQSFNQQMDPQHQQQMIFQMQQQQMMIQTDDQQMRYLNQQQHQQQHQQQQHQQQQQQQQHYQQQIQRNQNVEPVLPVDDDLDIPTSTVMGTRSNSERSLGSMNPGSVMTTGGWNSTLDTAANSSRALSPVSFSDIPASPTMCAQVFNLPMHPEDNQMTTQLNHPSAQNTTHYSSGSANTMTRSDGTTVPMDNLITPTYATLNVTNNAARKTSEDLESPDDILPGPSLEVEEEGDYAIISGAEQKSDDDLLTRSIQEEMPTSSSTPKLKVSPRLNGFFSPSQKTTSSPAWSHPDTSPILKQTQRPKHQEMTTDSDRLLMESIMSEMPRSRVISPRLASGEQQYLEPDRSSHSKNEEADRRDAIIASHEPSDQGMNVGRGSSPQQQQLHRMESLESQASSEDSFGLNGYQEEHNASSSAAHTMRIDNDDVVDASLPMDCVDDEDYDYTDDHFDDNYEEDYEDPDATQFDEGIDPQLTIDCSMISSGSGSSLQKTETTTGSRDSGALATSTPIGSVSSLPGVRRAKKVSINGKTRLPVPKTNGSLVDKIRKPVIEASRPRLPPKPSLLKGKQYQEEDLIENQTRDDTIYVNAPIVEAEQERIYMNALKHSQGSPAVNGTPPKSAIVSPYNYQKPPFTGRSNGEINEKNVTPNPKQMLVTIV